MLPTLKGIHFAFVIVLSTFIVCASSNNVGDVIGEDTVYMARCRAACIKEFLADSHVIDDDECFYQSNCKMCWETCRLLCYDSYEVWGEMCHRPEICFVGCQKACLFRDTQKGMQPVKETWIFPSKPYVWPSEVKLDETHMNWPEPLSPKPHIGFTPVVYTLYCRDGQLLNMDEEWEQLGQTVSRELIIETGLVSNQPRFWLVASTENGTVADIKFNRQSGGFGGSFNVPHEGVARAQPFTKQTYLDSSSPLSLTLNMSIFNGTIVAGLRWTHLKDKKLEELDYQVDLFFQGCIPDPGFAPCEYPQEHFDETYIENRNISHASMVLKDLMFNARYYVKVEMNIKPELSGKLMFNTPHCDSPTHNFQYCRMLHTEPIAAAIPIWKLSVINATFNSDTHMITVTFDLRTPITISDVTYRGSYEVVCQSSHLVQNFTRVNVDRITLDFPHDCYFDLEVSAVYKNSRGEELQYLSEPLANYASNYLPENLTVTFLQPGKVDALNIRSEEPVRPLDGVIIGITCVASIIILAIIVYIIYKKRRSFRDIMITKATVAKSNSYKSNVGCKTNGKLDYCNELLVVSDEWELDPKKVTFSSTLGQGAFGKVVTGYYSERKVAIKVVRDSAPLSYKEDLIAEINLMKKIGFHNNIVSLIGAITLCEPIALIMEYIPYGNLQNFLKKCRLEGELRKLDQGHSEITYSLIDDQGGVDNGVIAPSDMLSFARQIAMAMEYLSEHRYVHRDLAARNVLLDYNKVVKVCDFGLSRDIYNDSQYKKLTNGKLPLKWMAVESLRDRVFTTHSDVWSFGILLWEIVTLGASPYPNIALADLYYVLSHGYRMEKPGNCSDELYMLTRQCWIESPSERPSFTRLRVLLEEMLARDCNYLELDNIDVPLNDAENSSPALSDFSSSPLDIKSNQSTPTKDELTVDVCIHEKSTERLLQQSEHDSNGTLDYPNFKRKLEDMRSTHL